jgi:hypothetical protein
LSLVVVGSLAVACSSPVAAYKPGRPKVIALSETLVRTVIACRAAVERAEERASGGPSDVYKSRTRLRDAALARCGFPRDVLWRNAAYSVRIAAADLASGSHSDEPRATNRAVAAPFREQLSRMFAD